MWLLIAASMAQDPAPTGPDLADDALQRQRRIGRVVAGTGLGLTLAGTVGLVVLERTTPDLSTDTDTGTTVNAGNGNALSPTAAPTGKGRGLAYVLSGVAIITGVSWTGSGFTIVALAVPR